MHFREYIATWVPVTAVVMRRLGFRLPRSGSSDNSNGNRDTDQVANSKYEVCSPHNYLSQYRAGSIRLGPWHGTGSFACVYFALCGFGSFAYLGWGVAQIWLTYLGCELVEQ